MSDFGHGVPAPTGTYERESGAGIDPHRHDGHQLLYTSRGVLSVSTEAGVWTTPANRALWIPTGVVHEHRAFGATRIHLIGLPATTNPLAITRPAVVAVGPLLRELIIAYSAELDLNSPQSRRLRAVLLDRLHASPEQPLRLPTPRDPRLVDLGSLLDHNPSDARSVVELAAQIGTSPRTLARLCRRELGMSFPQWRTQIRLHHALRLLAVDTPVTVVAGRCGWATSSAFIEVFRKNFGRTPGRHDSPPHDPPEPLTGLGRGVRAASASPRLSPVSEEGVQHRLGDLTPGRDLVTVGPRPLPHLG